jgi:hypothetical protein
MISHNHLLLQALYVLLLEECMMLLQALHLLLLEE